MSRKIALCLLVVMLLAAVCNFVYWTDQKSGYHCDEIYSHGLSNKDFHYEIYDGDNIRWNTPEDIDSYLSVPHDGRFDYVNVYKNQMSDVHPPLFYIIMHSVGSLFPGTYSVYITAVPNILFTLGTCIFLYLIVMELTKKRSMSLLAVACFAFSVNAVNMVMYMRMYAQLAFFTTVALYLHMRIINSDYKLTPKMMVALFATVFLGTYTHYYFLIFIFAVVLYAVIAMLQNKRTGVLYKYLAVMGITAAIYAAVWPSVFKHLFFTPRGGQAFDNAVNSSLWNNMCLYLNVLVKGCGNLFIWLFIIAAGVCVIGAVRDKKMLREKYRSLYMLPFASVIYFLLIVKVAPFQMDRYISPVFPVFMVLLVYLMCHAMKLVFERFASWQRAVPVVMTCFAVAGLVTNTYGVLCKAEASHREENYLFLIPDDVAAVQETYKGKKCVMVHTEEWQFLRNLPDYKVFEETAFVKPDEIERLKETNRLADEQEFIVYINSEMNTDYVANMVKEAMDFDGAQLLTNSEARNRADIYRVYKK